MENHEHSEYYKRYIDPPKPKKPRRLRAGDNWTANLLAISQLTFSRLIPFLHLPVILLLLNAVLTKGLTASVIICIAITLLIITYGNWYFVLVWSRAIVHHNFIPLGHGLHISVFPYLISIIFTLSVLTLRNPLLQTIWRTIIMASTAIAMIITIVFSIVFIDFIKLRDFFRIDLYE